MSNEDIMADSKILNILTMTAWYDDYNFTQKHVVMLFGNNSRVINSSKRGLIFIFFFLF